MSKIKYSMLNLFFVKAIKKILTSLSMKDAFFINKENTNKQELSFMML